jgi:hypothetical protein
MIAPLALLLVALQQGGSSSPASGDTVGYWQQRVSYEITATLDEEAQKLRATGTLTYTNQSPDTLRELFVHQYLNAFRPGSRWSATDAREGRVRFQKLEEPDYAYERFTSFPLINGVAVRPQYPLAPDSTVVRLPLGFALPPGGTVRVQFAWDSRPSTTFRRQGRKGRHWDFSQWFPKVAVYDKGGWQWNALVPAGEFYGEFATYDVTLLVRDDQVLGATGVPVAGDPGWARVSRTGAPYIKADAYGDVPRALPAAPAGYRAVRFRAENVHHFAWSAAPDYRYEGGTYVRDARVPFHLPTWDTTAIHVLYRPGDDSTWGRGIAVDRTRRALTWLESIYGPYVYPQITNLHRLDGGGTEFPMMVMNGSASQGLILHEFGHVYTFGILANNEWRSGWMDEGLTDYQTDWALGDTPQEQAGRAAPPPRLPEGYRANAVTIPASENEVLGLIRLDLARRSEPAGRKSQDFREFAIYNAMIYSRAKQMYGQLRDVLGDTAFRAFLRDYYARWALKHVDERAMRASAERVSGKNLGWFFDQWVHRTGMVDYALSEARITPRVDGRWTTHAVVTRMGGFRHPMPVGVRTSKGWTIARADAMQDVSAVEFVTDERPLEVQLDPYHVTADWDRRNDTEGWSLLKHRIAFDWPFLNQADRDRNVLALAPVLWYSAPGGATLGFRAPQSYLGLVDRIDKGLAFTLRDGGTTIRGADTVQGHAASRVNAWFRIENPYLPFSDRPLMGQGGGIDWRDGIFRADWGRTWDISPFVSARGPRRSASLRLAGIKPTDRAFLPEQWDNSGVMELAGTLEGRRPVTERGASFVRARGAASLGVAESDASIGTRARGYSRAELEAQSVTYSGDTSSVLSLRLYGGVTANAPTQRLVFASTRDPLATFEENWWRPRGAILKGADAHYLPLGGAFLRGYGPGLALEQVGALNAEVGRKLVWERVLPGALSRLAVWGSAFGDIGLGAAPIGNAMDGAFLADAGVGVSVRGRLYDRDVKLRLDFPAWVHQPALAMGTGAGKGDIAFRWVWSVNDLW